MKCRLPLVLACLNCLAIAPIPVLAQPSSDATPPVGTQVAVLDVPKVFELHPQFKARMATLRQQVRSAEADLAGQQKELAVRGKALNNLRTDSPDYKKLEGELAHKFAGLKVQALQQKKEFLRQEARVYYETFEEIRRVVQRVAQKYGIGLVLRFDSSEVDPANPQSVAMGMNRPVVLQQGLDITPVVVDELRVSLASNQPNRSPRR